MDILDIAVIAGDGIGQEVVPAAKQVLDAACRVHGGVRLRWQDFPWNSQTYLTTGRYLPEDGLKILSGFPLIFFGAVGDPRVPDHVSLWELLIPLRREFDEYVNLRPIEWMPGVPSPLAHPEGMEYVIIRENTEGEYSTIGGRSFTGEREVAVQVALFTRVGTERLLRFAFSYARQRGWSQVVSATKSNGITVTMPFWDHIAREVAADYPDIGFRLVHVDALAAELVLRPPRHAVVVGSNLFGDILSDLGAAAAGGIGLAPSANLNPERRYPSLFEPVHGSAPDIAGQGKANPIGQIATGALMMEFAGYPDIADRIRAAIRAAVREGSVTSDLGGRLTTQEAAAAVARHVERDSR